MRYLRMTGAFIRASALQELAYRANFLINLANSGLNLAVSIAGLAVLFTQVQSVRGWTFPSILALLGVFLTVSALGGMVVRPSFEAMMGMDGEMLTGRLDFALLRPASIQFLASFRVWRLFQVVDLLLGLGVLAAAVTRPGQSLSAAQIGLFALTLAASLVMIYGLLLAFTALTFWSPGVLFTWIFDAIFQLARYPVGIYPAWLRIFLTWAFPVVVMTTLPAQALTGDLPLAMALYSLAAAGVILVGASLLFRQGLKRYNSASS